MAFKTLDKTAEFIRECLALGRKNISSQEISSEAFSDERASFENENNSIKFEKSGAVKHCKLENSTTNSTFNTAINNERAKQKSDGLKSLEDYADERMIPVLLPESAAFLKQLCMLHRPKKVLEVGMGIGYSGHIILQNSPAHLFTIEHNDEFVDLASGFFKKSDLIERVTFLRGDESDIIPMIDGEFDMIFLDGAKTRYASHLPYLKKLLSPYGVLLADNVLFNGMVAAQKSAGKKQSIVEGLRTFLKNLCSDADFTTSILPVGDGVSLSIKIN